jgi:hypothetical protein
VAGCRYDIPCGLMLDYIMSTASELLPTSRMLLDEAFTPKSDFDARLRYLRYHASDDAPIVYR